MFSEFSAGDKFLGDHAGDAEHGEAAIVDFFRGHILEALGGGRFETEGVEAEVAGDVVVDDLPPTLGVGIFECRNRGLEFDEADGGDDEGPELLERGLLEGEVRGRVDVAAEQRVEFLADEESGRREHCQTGVLDFDFLVEFIGFPKLRFIFH